MKAFLSASPCIFFENETLFHEGENSWAGREKSSHFSILKEKNTLSSPTLLRLFWNFVYVQISVFPLSPSWVRDSLLGKEGGINTYGGVGGVSFVSLPFAFRFLFSCPHPLFGDVSQNGRMGDEGGGGGIRKPSCVKENIERKILCRLRHYCVYSGILNMCTLACFLSHPPG